MSKRYEKITNTVELPVSFNPKTTFPLDARSMFGSLSEAETAAQSAKDAGSSESVYYYGQMLTVFDGTEAKSYIIQGDNTLKEICSLNSEEDATVIEQKDTLYTGDTIFDGENYSLKTGMTVPGANASGLQAAALGGTRYDSVGYDYIKVGSVYYDIVSKDPYKLERYDKEGTCTESIEIPSSPDELFTLQGILLRAQINEKGLLILLDEGGTLHSTEFCWNINGSRTPTSAEGPQSFAWGGSSHAYGAWSMAGGKDAKAYQGGSISLGGSCTAGLSESDITSYYGQETSDIDNENNKIVVPKLIYTGGKLHRFAYYDPNLSGDAKYIYNTSNGQTGFTKAQLEQFGFQDEAGGPITYEGNRFCFAANTSRSVGYGSASFNSGKSIGRTSFAANTATVEGAYSAGFGQNNTITVTAPNAFVAGAVNTVQFDKSSALGWNLKTTRESQTVLGRYNNYNENTDDLLQVGGGINSDIRYNFFGVRGDGRGYLYKGPQEANDIVRLQELNSLVETGAVKTNTDNISKLNTNKLDKFSKSNDGMYWIYAHHPNPSATGTWNKLLAPLVGDVAAHKTSIINSQNDSVPLYYRAKNADGTFEGFTLICDTPENLTDTLKAKSVVNRKYLNSAISNLYAPSDDKAISINNSTTSLSGLTAGGDYKAYMNIDTAYNDGNFSISLGHHILKVYESGGYKLYQTYHPITESMYLFKSQKGWTRILDSTDKIYQIKLTMTLPNEGYFWEASNWELSMDKVQVEKDSIVLSSSTPLTSGVFANWPVESTGLKLGKLLSVTGPITFNVAGEISMRYPLTGIDQTMRFRALRYCPTDSYGYYLEAIPCIDSNLPNSEPFQIPLGTYPGLSALGQSAMTIENLFIPDLNNLLLG